VLFGAGAALALDEFALWLHLEDVYWTEEGRKSIDAVRWQRWSALATGVIGFPIPLVALVGAVRLAKPGSYWARRFYREAKMESARERFGPRQRARRERLRDLFSGGS